jgi:hypothetical protein
MKSTRRVILLSLLALVGIGLVVYFLRPTEPKYQGKTVREWLEILNRFAGSPSAETDKTAARLVFQQMGTNMLPVVLEELRAQDSKWTMALHSLAQKQSFITIPFTPALARQLTAMTALDILGKSSEGPAAASWLVQRLASDIDYPTRVNLINAVGELGPVAEAAIPVLLASLKNANRSTRQLVLPALSRIRRQPDLVLPALIESLHDKDELVRLRAAQVFPFFGKEAQRAVSALRFTATNDVDAEVRRMAADALRDIGAASADEAADK